MRNKWSGDSSLWSTSWQETSKHKRLEKEGVFSLACNLVSCFAFPNLQRCFINAFRKSRVFWIFSMRQDCCWSVISLRNCAASAWVTWIETLLCPLRSLFCALSRTHFKIATSPSCALTVFPHIPVALICLDACSSKDTVSSLEAGTVWLMWLSWVYVVPSTQQPPHRCF